MCGAQREPLAPALGAAAVARLVRDDREQPGAKRRAAAEARQRAPGLRQPDLGGVLGVGGVAGDQVCGAEGDLLVVADERGESGGVATTCALDELVLCRWSAHHSVLLHPLGSVGSMARAVGINHIALEVGSLDEALAFYGSLFELELRGRIRGMAFIDMGDQFLALAERTRRGSRTRSATSASSSTTATAVLAAAREAGVEIFGGNSFRDPWGNHVQVVEYGDIQFTKTPEILRGMGLELEKSESALRGAARQGSRLTDLEPQRPRSTCSCCSSRAPRCSCSSRSSGFRTRSCSCSAASRSGSCPGCPRSTCRPTSCSSACCRRSSTGPRSSPRCATCARTCGRSGCSRSGSSC